MSFKSFSVAAVALASVATANYQPYNILVDGSTVTKYVRSQDWGTISVGSNSLRVSKNNNVFL